MESKFDYEPAVAHRPRRRREPVWKTVAYEVGSLALIAIILLTVWFAAMFLRGAL